MVNETLWNLSSAYRRLFRWKRWVQLIVIFVTHISESIYLKLRWKVTHRGSPPTAGERLRRLFERLGPAYIKFAQVLSNRPEVPEDVLKELKKLQDKVPGFPYEQVEEQVKKELGAPIDEIYLYFEKEPIAAASIGQVHRAVLKNGEKVAVKIQRPNIQYLIENDIDIMVTMVRAAEFFSEAARIFNFRPTLEAFKVATLRELDYIIEGRS
ncbi:MAG: AarF/ABC1/UbiB kinase family protein, partial [Euryarchaeota archaeon]|nr:AarF/ABC1/UbiB kinase family protein [Euryarchaeota archaeon]